MRDNHFWTTEYTSFSRLVQFVLHFIPKVTQAKRSLNIIGHGKQITHLNKATSKTFIPGKETSFDEGVFAVGQNTILYHQTTTANQISIELTVLFFQMHLVVKIIF